MMVRKTVRDTVAAIFFAYRDINAGEDSLLRQEIDKVESPEMRDRIMELTNPWIRAGKQQGLQEGLQEGILRGRQQGEADLVLRLLSRRFGAISGSQEKTIRKLPLASSEALGEALLEFASRADLARWLRLHK
jgi:flagellar biosynthesis/type III secretory pathway protein FliH